MSKITLVQTQKRNKSRVNVHIDGEFYCGMEAFSALKFGIKEGAEIDEKTLEESIFDSEVDIAFNKSINYLSKSMKTESQMQKYLMGKDFSPQVVDRVLEKLKGYRYVDDDTYAKLFSQQNCQSKGAVRLKQEMLQKGISRDLVEQTLLDLPCDHAENAEKLAEKFMRNKPNDLKTLLKLQNYLLRRGYSFDQVNSTLQKFKSTNDD